MLTLPRINTLDPNCFRSKMNLLRDKGLEYIAHNGKIMPPKLQPDLFCHCPQRCRKKLTKEQWQDLFDQFYKLANQSYQNKFLQNHIVIRTVHAPKGSPTSPSKRRVSCKYHIPKLKDGETIDMFVDQRAEDLIDVCQKAFMNIYGLTEKRIRKQRETCIENLIPDYYMKKTGIDYSKYYKDADNELKTSLNNESGDDQPLDLSNHSNRSYQIKNLDEFAVMLGVSTKSVNQEMIDKYEKMVEESIKKGTKRIRKRQNKQIRTKTISESEEQEVGSSDSKVHARVSNNPHLNEFANILGLLKKSDSNETSDRFEKVPKISITIEKRQKEVENKHLNGLSKQMAGLSELSIIPAQGPTHSERSSQNKHLTLDNLSDMLEVSKKLVNQEMIDKYEVMLEHNLAMKKQRMRKKQKTKHQNDTLHGLAEQLAGLDELPMIPTQILNNGNITITPVPRKTEEHFEPDQSQEENDDIMQVDSFFQNQLWQPEYFDSSRSESP